MKKILIVEDDLYIGGMLQEALGQAGYAATRAYSGTEAVLAVRADRPDLVLLDLMLPGLSGEEALGQLGGVPVIVVSAKGDVEDKVVLLMGGAADYVTKPFEMRELLARIAAVLRRAASPQDAPLCVADLTMDERTREVCAAGEAVHLTRTEYAILRLLMENPGQVMTKTRLLEESDAPDGTDGSLKMHMSNLRRKLRGARVTIEAVWGIGFRLTES